MPETFYPGQNDYLEKLNELWAVADAAKGDAGWGPVIQSIAVGEKTVLQIADWVGGSGPKPPTGYIGPTGLTSDIDEATDVKGEPGIQGLKGDQGWAPLLQIVDDAGRKVLEVTDWVGGAGTKPTTLGYLGVSGIVTDIEDAVAISGPQGIPGKEIELQTSATHIQWKYTTDPTWVDLVALSTITGTNGKEVQLQTNATHIQWKYSTDPTWADLIALSALKGDNGTEVELQATATHIQWRYVGTPTWTDLIALTVITGNNGWVPELAIEIDGARCVQVVVDWFGGTGTKPTTGLYVGSTGLVIDIGDAVDIRGIAGAGTGDVVGPDGTTDSHVALFDGTTGKLLKSGGVLPTGDVVGPDTVTDNHVALFDGVTGKLLKDGGVLNTGAYAEEDRWKLQGFFVTAIFQGSAPTWALGDYYSQSDVLVANGHRVIRALNGDVYTMTDGVWVLTNPFDANPNGSRIAFAQTGDIGPFLWTRSAGSTVRTLMQQGSGNLRYSEGTAGVDFANYTVRNKLNEIGRLIDLTTSDKGSIVAAINELVAVLGTLPTLSFTGDWDDIDGKPAVIAAGVDAAEARTAIGAGTSNLALGATTGTALEGDTSFVTVNGTSVKGSGSLEVGYRNIPQNSKSAAYTLVLYDAGCHIFHPAADTTARIFTIPANSSVAYPIGTAITFINQNGTGGVVTIAITTDTMRLAGAGTTGSRTLARNGIATAVKITSTEWIISGTGLT